MNIVIPMAGAGRRFVEAGWALPKPLLPAHGRTLLEWSVDSLPLHLATRLVFVGLEEHRRAHGFEEFITRRYEQFRPLFRWLPETTRGQSETVLVAADLLDPGAGLVIFNIDTAYTAPGLESALLDPGNDGVLVSFPSAEPRFSYARMAGGRVVEVREKKVISHHALTGLYHFRHTWDFLTVAEAAIAAGQREAGEYYVAPLYNRLIEEGRNFVVHECEGHWILGTPAEYETFLQGPPPAIPRR